MIRVLAPYHEFNAIVAAIPVREWLTPVYLPSLTTNPPNGPGSSLAESRVFLSDLVPPNTTRFFGQINARAIQKYDWLGFTWDRLQARFDYLFADDVVVAPWPVGTGPNRHTDWVGYSEGVHPGMGALLDEMARFTGLTLTTDQSCFWANDFICHRDVWMSFREFFRKVFWYFYNKYGFDLPFEVNKEKRLDPVRKPAYLYERIACLYFSNRSDLRLVSL